MTVLTWILGMSFVGGALSVLAAAGFAFAAKPHWVQLLISYAIGALLGASFLEVLPHAMESAGSPERGAANLLAGILLFFVLEKLVLWRHCHHEHCEGHEPHAHGEGHGRAGMLIIIGDTFHNFVDGVLIAAAFLQNIELGIVTALAIIAHEIPQEVGDFFILLHSGYTRRQALAFNLFSTLATVVGGLLAYFALQAVQGAIPVMLAMAAASMIYVAVADLIPGLHKRHELRATLQQVLLIAAGIGTIVLAHRVVDGLLG